MANPLLIAKGETDCFILPKMANRTRVSGVPIARSCTMVASVR
jgi:hypothetical protein